MTPSEFVIWFRGFVKAANTFNITPKQWDSICEYLEKVRLENESKDWRQYTLDISNSNNWTTTTITADGRNDITYKTDAPTTNTI